MTYEKCPRCLRKEVPAEMREVHRYGDRRVCRICQEEANGDGFLRRPDGSIYGRQER